MGKKHHENEDLRIVYSKKEEEIVKKQIKEEK